MRNTLVSAVIMTSICLFTNAYASTSGPIIKGGTCYGTPQSLSCDHIGKNLSIKDIYDKGWRVVAYVQVSPNTISLVIEEQR